MVYELPSLTDSEKTLIGLGEYSTIASSGLHECSLTENAAAGR